MNKQTTNAIDLLLIIGLVFINRSGRSKGDVYRPHSLKVILLSIYEKMNLFI